MLAPLLGAGESQAQKAAPKPPPVQTGQGSTAPSPSHLAAARALGLQTAFISRPHEYGTPDERAVPSADWDIVCHSVIELAERLAA